MINLSVANTGEFGDGDWFSSLYVNAAQSNLTGGVLVKGPDGDAAVFFRDGRPVHAAGTGFKSHYLGGLLVEMKACSAEQVDAAVAKQGLTQNPPLLGSILVADAGVRPDDVKRAMQAQNSGRFTELFAWSSGQWTAAPGDNARIRDLGVMTPVWPLFFSAMTDRPCDVELRALADRLLGRSVQLKGGSLGIVEYEPNKLEKRLITYLDKPRKPDQLERALKKRRAVRGFLRALELLERLSVLPVSKGIAIPRATLLSVDLPGVEQAKARARATSDINAQPITEVVVPPPSRPAAKRRPPVVREVEALHAELDNKNYFELLGADHKTPPAELRKLFTTLAKKYHPDAFPNDVEDEVAVKARELTAALNEAYQTLSNDEKRSHYMVLLSDVRIKGDMKRVEKVREAEMKAKMGGVMLKKRDYVKARELFKRAIELDPETGDYKAHYAWSVFADPKSDRNTAVQEALPLVKQALAKQADSPTVHFYMAQLLKAQGNDKDALHHFKQTLRYDRKHTEAQREVRLLELRQDKQKQDQDNSGGGRLSRLFKRN